MFWDFFWDIVGRKAAEPINNKPMPVIQPAIKKIPLKEDQYYQTIYPKKYIFLHHTAGGSAASSIAAWAANPEHIGTPYIIDRDGTIYETFDPKFWIYSLGVKGNSSIEKAAIPIEICCYGMLTEKNGQLITYTGKAILPGRAVKLDKPFRGGVFWEAYTPEQIAALKQLLPYLIDKFKIKLQADRTNFWEFQDPSKLPSGIYSHTTVRKDKIDIFPQKEIIDLVYSL